MPIASTLLGCVVYHTRISYRTRMVHTIRVYAYGTTVRVWYGYLYHMRIALLYYYCLQATYNYIAITITQYCYLS